MKDSRAIQQLFERYQRERTAFAGSMFELARHDANCELLEAAGGAPFLQALLADPVPGIRRAAAMALGRLAAQSESVANKLVADGAVRTLADMLSAPLGDGGGGGEAARRREGLELRRAAAFTLRSACKHGKVVTRAAVDAGALAAAAACLALPDAETREGAAWLLDTVASQGEDMAQTVIDVGALGQLVSSLEFSEIGLKRGGAAALGSVAQHGPHFAAAVAAAGAMAPLAALMVPGEGMDPRLARHVLCALSAVAQGGADLAAAFVAAGGLPAVTRLLASPDELVQRFAAAALRDVACHDAALAGAVAATPGALQLLIQVAQGGKGLHALPGIMALGWIFTASRELADAAIAAGGLTALAVAVAHNPEEPAKCAAAWAVGQAGKHGALQAQAVAESGALLALTGLEVGPGSSADLAAKCSKAACAVMKELGSLPALDALVRIQSSDAVKIAVLDRLAEVLAADAGPLKAAFVQGGGLELVQALGEDPGSPYNSSVTRITANFPQELVNRYSPAYNRQMLERLAGAAGAAPPPTAAPPRPPSAAAAPVPAAPAPAPAFTRSTAQSAAALAGTPRASAAAAMAPSSVRSSGYGAALAQDAAAALRFSSLPGSARSSAAGLLLAQDAAAAVPPPSAGSPARASAFGSDGLREREPNLPAASPEPKPLEWGVPGAAAAATPRPAAATPDANGREEGCL